MPIQDSGETVADTVGGNVDQKSQSAEVDANERHVAAGKLSCGTQQGAVTTYYYRKVAVFCQCVDRPAFGKVEQCRGAFVWQKCKLPIGNHLSQARERGCQVTGVIRLCHHGDFLKHGTNGIHL